MLLNLWNPFVLDVAQGPRVDDGEADDEDVRLVVGDQSQFVVLFLTCEFKRNNFLLIQWKPLNNVVNLGSREFDNIDRMRTITCVSL